MDLEKMIEKIKNHPDSSKMGMIASHLGIVRATSRDGQRVKHIQVSYDLRILNIIINNIKKLPGIIEVIAEVNEGQLQVGDEILFVAIGGDIRENVFQALIQAVDLIKKDACKKREFLA
ncbi:MAG: molybdenum cofactor biosynthesis protein MoaE [Deltaproteobacteria bacterium]|nr:molybdenum cofactor biosynthesis protein MoaE [Deltaproteobacteria bacterium]